MDHLINFHSPTRCYLSSDDIYLDENSAVPLVQMLGWGCEISFNSTDQSKSQLYTKLDSLCLYQIIKKYHISIFISFSKNLFEPWLHEIRVFFGGISLTSNFKIPLLTNKKKNDACSKKRHTKMKLMKHETKYKRRATRPFVCMHIYMSVICSSKRGISMVEMRPTKEKKTFKIWEIKQCM